MNKWNENKLDKELEELLNDLPEQEDDFDKRIEQYINRRIRKIVHKTLIMVLVVVVALLAVINPILNIVNLNPKKEVYLAVLRDYYETTRPYSEIVGIEAISKGFGCYKLNMVATNHHEEFHYGKINVTANMTFGKVKDIDDNNTYLANVFGRFDNSWIEIDDNGNESRHRNPKEYYIVSISKLPESSKIYLSLHSNSPQELETLRNSGVNVEWLEVYQETEGYRGGLSINLSALHEETDDRQEMSEEELLEIYIQNLENLIDNPSIWRQFELPGAEGLYHGDVNLLEDTLANAKQLNQILTENYCIYGERDAIINYLENTNILSVHIDDVKLF